MATGLVYWMQFVHYEVWTFYVEEILVREPPGILIEEPCCVPLWQCI